MKIVGETKKTNNEQRKKHYKGNKLLFIQQFKL